MNDSLSGRNISPYKVESIMKALNLNNVESNVANVASSTSSAVSLLNDIKAQNVTIISLLQQLVNK